MSKFMVRAGAETRMWPPVLCSSLLPTPENMPDVKIQKRCPSIGNLREKNPKQHLPAFKGATSFQVHS